MKSKIFEHHRGMHTLPGYSDQQVLARAKLKGLVIHPDIESKCSQKATFKSQVSIRRRNPLS